jgi:hypothetical protein
MKTMTSDEIAVISENELRNRIDGIKNLLTYNSKRNSVHLQIDLCYLQREAEIRVARKAAHEEYLVENRKKHFSKNNNSRRHFQR